jgi:uncharacterized protein (DUF362 family)
MISSKIVAIASGQELIRYPVQTPFFPDEMYPELNGGVCVGKERNIAYGLLRQLMFSLGMDVEHFSTHDWNPLGEIIRPGQKILIKPNLVRHLHLGGGDYSAVVTHGSLVRCVLDYAALALKGKGEIVVGDAPIQSADWSRILERTGLREACDDVSKIWQIPVRLEDFRLWSVQLDENHQIIQRNTLGGDPKGYVGVDLGKRSLLAPLGSQSEKFRVTNYDCKEMSEHHNETKNEYLIPRTILESDVVINLPKLKTHRKVGLTACLKNIVGINGHKDWLPHHRCGSVKEGGDEYLNSSILKRVQNTLGEQMDGVPYSPSNAARRFIDRILARLIRHMAPDPFFEGSWYGNDTLWRTVLDLNRLLVYANREGKMTETCQRQCLTVVDAIVAGEGEGPMEPDPRPLGILVGGVNPVAVDSVLATMIGFDYRKIPLIAKGFEIKDWPIINFDPTNIEVRLQDDRCRSLRVGEPFREFNFKPPSGWIGHVESSQNTSQ